jgi:kynurenine formamidase
MAHEAPSEQQIREWIETLSNWGRWGPNDELGTLNFVTPEKRRRAAALVREGITVSCARQIKYDLEPDVIRPVYHFMSSSGDRSDPMDRSGSGDFFLIAPHGWSITHVDALSHLFWRGQMYNGKPASLVTTEAGATAHSIEALKDGVMTRGVLLDVPRVLGRPWLEHGEGIFPEDLAAAERAEGVRVESGDVLLIRTGFVRWRYEKGPGPPGSFPGPQAACLPWLHERQVAMLGCDVANDALPSGYPGMALPIHTVGIPAMGLWLLDNCDHEALAATCERLNRWEFQLVIGPLRFMNGTGSPVNPIAIF